jgi:hypothetical protein
MPRPTLTLPQAMPVWRGPMYERVSQALVTAELHYSNRFQRGMAITVQARPQYPQVLVWALGRCTAILG